MNNDNDTSSISFTAHYTGYVWHHYGLSDSHFATTRGKLFFMLLRPFERIARCLIGSDIKTTLLQRHFLIDRELDALIATHPGLQILEIACGLSPRGHRFTRRHAGISYVEADLPGMVARKHALLAQLGSLDARHRLVTCNILDRGTPDSLEAVIAREFDAGKPLVVITEGLVNYFDLATISGVWRRLATALRTFPLGVYLTDIYPEVGGHRFSGAIRASNRALRVASRSSFTLHFASDGSMRAHFASLGFAQVEVFDPDRERTAAPAARGGAIVRVVKASAEEPGRQ
ncbi:MAG: methyltransferase [Moraxellaceae bacterium]|jgi:O-methyltransferase involved in polyketide biosynthesis|nr:methyltransferase [Moraxellaceae bacterium]